MSANREFRTRAPVRAFPAHPDSPTAIDLYLESRRARPKLNPYADVEASLARKGVHMSAVGLVRSKALVDPYARLPYVDQDDAWAICKKARRLRIRIHRLGISAAAERADQLRDQIKHRSGADDAHAMHEAAAAATIDLGRVGRQGWRRVADQSDANEPVAAKQPVRGMQARGKAGGFAHTSVDNAPSARRGASLTLLSPEQAILFGGALRSASGKLAYSNQVFRLCMGSGRPVCWERLDTSGSVPHGRAFHAAVLLEGTRIVVFGGIGALGMTAQCVLFDVHTTQWSKVFQSAAGGCEVPSPRHGHSMTETKDKSTAVLFGGAGAGFFNDVHFIDCFTGRWSQREIAGEPPAPRAFHSACALEQQSRIMIFGGQNGGANLSDLFELNVEQRTWTFVHTSGTQPAPRWGHVAFAQGLDSMLIFGGGGEGFFSDLLHFSSYKRAWREVCAPGEAPEGRWGHVSVVVAETARLYVFGGASAREPFRGDAYVLDTSLLEPVPQHPKLAAGAAGATQAAALARAAEGVHGGRAVLPRYAVYAEELRRAAREEKPVWAAEKERGAPLRWSAPRYRQPMGPLALLASVVAPQGKGAAARVPSSIRM